MSLLVCACTMFLVGASVFFKSAAVEHGYGYIHTVYVHRSAGS